MFVCGTRMRVGDSLTFLTEFVDGRVVEVRYGAEGSHGPAIFSRYCIEVLQPRRYARSTV